MTLPRRTRAWLVAAIVGVLAFAVRLANVGAAFPEGAAVVPPLDDLYHARRIVVSALDFPEVLEFDPARGAGGAFCPWPPLYDLAAGGLARLSGARTPGEVLDRAALFPPLAGAFTAFAAAFALATRRGLAASVTAGGLLAITPALVEVSSVSDLDHHFLEGGLLLGVVAAALSAIRARQVREAVVGALLLGAALAAALFVQVALLLGAACAALALLLLARSRAALLAGSGGFALAAVAVGAWRALRPPGMPSASWFLGLPHAAALLAAAVALGVAALLELRHRPGPARAVGAAVGVATFLAIPGAAVQTLAGLAFFGGDPWLDQVSEFRPLLEVLGGDPTVLASHLGGGVLLVVPFALLAARRGTEGERAVALFVGVLLAASFARVRFVSQAAPLLAVAAGLLVSDRALRGRPAVAAALAAAALVPAAVGVWPLLAVPPEPVPAGAGPALRVAELLRRDRTTGRVLALENWGHAFNVLGRREVLVDPFGTAGNPLYGPALTALLTTREERLAAFCREHRVRFLVLENPLATLPGTAARAGFDPDAYLVPGPGPDDPPRLTRLLQATVWWRAYFNGGRARPELGPGGEPLRSFVLVYEDPARVPQPPPYGGPALQVWEFRDPA